ncbi:MAG: Abi-alpha family protein, partial [Saprospiraceae bacterium]
MSIPDALGEVAKQSVKQLAPEIYSDGIKPGMKKLGAALETVIDLINTCLVPVAILNDRARLVWDKHLINRQKYLLDYEQNLLKIPEEKIVSPIPEIAVPILQRLEYTQNDQLAKMFLNLLTTASNSDTE